MRRIAATLVLIAALAAACGQPPRPEGQVERWLRSMNQGPAGDPAELADPALSEIVVPGWAAREPESIDRIVVGIPEADGGAWSVPFAIHELDGRSFTGVATVDPLADPPIRAVAASGPLDAEPTTSSVPVTAWLAAGVIGVGIAAVCVVAVGWVRRRAEGAA